jgi:hypothetical protein
MTLLLRLDRNLSLIMILSAIIEIFAPPHRKFGAFKKHTGALQLEDIIANLSVIEKRLVGESCQHFPRGRCNLNLFFYSDM